MAIQIRTTLDEPDTGTAFVPHKPARPDKAEGGRKFVLRSDYEPAGDQPQAIKELTEAALDGEKSQVLLGVTGSGKTFTMAKVIETLQRPALVIAPNKILAAQLYGEFKSFFPDNAVEYFVSYYDYYQPEAYVPRTDTYIEKESSVNEAIDRMRHSATRSLLERDDVIIVASVSCLYGIGSVETYSAMIFDLKKGAREDQGGTLHRLDHLGHGEGLARTGDPEQHLALFAVERRLGQFLDCLRLVAGRFVIGPEHELPAALGLVRPRRLVRHERRPGVRLVQGRSDLNRHASRIWWRWQTGATRRRRVGASR